MFHLIYACVSPDLRLCFECVARGCPEDAPCGQRPRPLQSRPAPRTPRSPGGRATISDGTAANEATGAAEAPEAHAAARPFLKWAGGKTQILEELVARSPERIDTYYEPFLGGGALFFRLAADPQRRPRRAVLNDLNHELIAAFRAVRDDAGALIERLGERERAYLDLDGAGRGDYYYAVRQEYRDVAADGGASDIEVASRLIFLNKTCFNGLYRVNRRGEFNVPHGRYVRPRILDAAGLEAASAALTGVELRSMDFKEACTGAGAGDFVYFDPPFQPLTRTSNFTAYTEGGFGRDDQLRLKWWVDELSRLGVPALVSNSADKWLRGVYEGGGYVASELDRAEPFWPELGRAEEVTTNRLINSRGDLRQDFVELLISNHALLAASKKKS